MAVTDLDVKNIIDTDRDTTPFIAVARLLVDEVLASSSLSAERKDAICKYLAAHLVWLTESSGLVSKDVGSAREVYRTFSDKSSGLGTSRFGETALALDTTGTLAAATTNNGLKALFTVVQQHGNPPSGWPGWTDIPGGF